MKALIIILGLMFVASCECVKASAQSPQESIEKRQLEAAREACNGNLVYRIAFQGGETKPYYYRYLCVPVGTNVNVEVK